MPSFRAVSHSIAGLLFWLHTFGIRVIPPTRITSLTSLVETPASLRHAYLPTHLPVSPRLSAARVLEGTPCTAAPSARSGLQAERWGDVGRYACRRRCGERWGEVGRGGLQAAPVARRVGGATEEGEASCTREQGAGGQVISPHIAPYLGEQGAGRCGEIWGDVGRYRVRGEQPPQGVRAREERVCSPEWFLLLSPPPPTPPNPPSPHPSQPPPPPPPPPPQGPRG